MLPKGKRRVGVGKRKDDLKKKKVIKVTVGRKKVGIVAQLPVGSTCWLGLQRKLNLLKENRLRKEEISTYVVLTYIQTRASWKLISLLLKYYFLLLNDFLHNLKYGRMYK